MGKWDSIAFTVTPNHPNAELLFKLLLKRTILDSRGIMAKTNLRQVISGEDSLSSHATAIAFLLFRWSAPLGARYCPISNLSALNLIR